MQKIETKHQVICGQNLKKPLSHTNEKMQMDFSK